MGVITGIGGGVMRDLLTGQPTIISRRELYMTPILVGVGLYVVAVRLAPADRQALSVAAILLITAVRASAIRWGWAFPDWLTYKPLREKSR